MKIIANGVGEFPVAMKVTRDKEKLAVESEDSIGISISGISVEGETVTLNCSYQGVGFELKGKRNGEKMLGMFDIMATRAHGRPPKNQMTPSPPKTGSRKIKSPECTDVCLVTRPPATNGAC